MSTPERQSNVAEAGNRATAPNRSLSGDTAGVAVEVRGLSKVFPGTKALDAVDLEVRHGEIQGLVGGNGCGKSTLIKILSGVIQGDEGEIMLAGQSFDATTVLPMFSYEYGVRVVHQDLAVFPDLSVAENMMLGSAFPTDRFGNVRWREVNRRVQSLIQRFEVGARPRDLIKDLPVAARTQVAIARAMQDASPDKGLIILDEPTAALPGHEAKALLAAMRRLAAKGHAIVFVSHRLDEVMAVTDRITVMRDGKVYGRYTTADITEIDLIDAMLGRRITSDALQHAPVSRTGPPILKISNLDADVLRNINLEVYPGEIVGVAGLLGSGRSELLRVIYGDLKKESGSVAVKGRKGAVVAPKTSDAAIDAGVVMIPEDRANGGVFPDLSVDANLNLSVLKKYWRGIGFRSRSMNADAGELRNRFRVKAPTGRTPMASLSGGNQQKAILARWMRVRPTLLLLDEPTQGVDLGARTDIYAAIRDAIQEGSAALLVASDLEELSLFADRAVVLRDGEIVAEVAKHELSAHRLNELIYMDRTNNG